MTLGETLEDASFVCGRSLPDFQRSVLSGNPLDFLPITLGQGQQVSPELVRLPRIGLKSYDTRLMSPSDAGNDCFWGMGSVYESRQLAGDRPTTASVAMHKAQTGAPSESLL